MKRCWRWSLTKRCARVTGVQTCALPILANDQNRFRKLMKEQSDLAPIVEAYNEYKSANKAAEKLYVNYRTLSSRLKKIKDISGIDFKNSAEMLAVRNGIVLFKMAETL